MYCPRCSTQNMDSARFCRACGANLSLVPQALTGKLPEAQSEGRGRRRRRREPSLGGGITRTFIGMAFLLIAMTITFSGRSSGSALWLLIPAFIILGRGIGELVTLLNAERKARQLAPPPITQNTPQPPTNPLFEQLTPPSVTEGTTRHLDAVSKNDT